MFKCHNNFLTCRQELVEIIKYCSKRYYAHRLHNNWNLASIFHFHKISSCVDLRNSKHIAMSTSDNRSSSNSIERKVDVLETCINLEGEIVKGFGRGSREIGCPTANFNDDIVESKLPKSFNSGIYMGWARLDGDEDKVEKAVVSIGWNPFYGNTKKSVETHIIKKYDSDFYGRWMKLRICCFIRPELNFNGLEELINAIKDDIEHAKTHLDKDERLLSMKDDKFLHENSKL